MTERGLPIVDGAPACPFVAFEDDRDERAASPDHRHRCYAEAQPAPRALAHQEAYCLSSAFPVCPTFQDWARREAARARDAGKSRPLTSDAAEDGGVGAASGLPGSQRNPPRNWAAPPPWMSRRGGEGATDSLWADDDDDEQADEPVVPELPRRGRGLSGSYADRVASDPVDGIVDDDAAPTPAGVGAGALAAAAAAEARDEASIEELDAAEDARMREPLSRRREPSVPNYRDDGWNESADSAEVAPRRRRERDSAGPVAAAAETAAGGSSARSGPSRGPAPEWERARPLEAYPTLRSRHLAELSIPPILVAVVAIALAAAVLFALPGLLGFGNPSAGGSASPSHPSVTALPSLPPTTIPQATPVVYVVQSGDTLSRIAGRFGITLADLIAANTDTLPNPDKLAIGDRLVIPAPLASALPAASEIPAPS